MLGKCVRRAKKCKFLSNSNSIGQSVFELVSGNRNVDGQPNGQKTNEQTELLHQFRKEPSYDGDLSPCQV